MDARDGRVLYSFNARKALIPGSTTKLITAATAISSLGPTYRFATTLASDGTVDGSQLDGNLWLIGGGDPELTSDDLRRGIGVLAHEGIDGIEGNVYVDGSRYGPDDVVKSWLPDDLQYGWAAPATALTINGDSVQFTITPKEGSEADVAVDPPGQRIIASVETVASDADNTLTIDPMPGGDGYIVSGDIPYGAAQKYWRAIPHPTQATATTLLAMLKLAGIDVGGAAGADPAPAQHVVLWQHRSRALDQIIKQMFFLSDNHYAEQLLREVGWKASGIGTLANSLRAEHAFLTQLGIPSDQAVLADGSGLSEQNKVSANALAGVLRFMLDQPMPDPPYSLLPRAGIEGTVQVRDLDPDVLGHVYAKDGYVDGASSIAGYVLTEHHGPVIFAFVVNNWQQGLDAVWTAEDQMLDTIVRY